VWEAREAATWVIFISSPASVLWRFAMQISPNRQKGKGL